MTQLNHMPDIEPAQIKQLALAGVHTCEQLLTLGGTARGRSEIAAASGIGAEQLLEWVKWADLERIEGIDPQRIDCLAQVGVECLADLAHSEAQRLAAKLDQRDSGGTCAPDTEQLERWIERARELPRLVHI